MKTNKIIFFLILLFTGFLTLKITHSYFSDSGTSSNNVLSASAVFPSATPTVTLTPTSTPAIANHVVISEVQISGGNGQDAANDFIELYNPTSSSFDLNGHRLVLRNGSSSNDVTITAWISSSIIAAHGYYLWANDGFASSIGANVSSNDTLGASNSIALRLGNEDTGTIIDQLSWNSASQSLKEGTHFSPDPGDNASMERKAYLGSTSTSMGSGGTDETKGNGFDSNNNLTDFYTRATSQPQNTSSPTETP